ncbi:MAG TPA: O-antigen ligase family protein, partial [Solirubrobacterales bacterium]|nr:O-antigen ligase family protein [Solirubrobacterales bacterium]
SYPLDYWNGLAALISIGLPLLLHLASEARHAVVRGLAAAALPAMILALFLTLSRAGIAAGVIAVAVYLLLAHDRLPKALILAIAGAGGGLLILLASRRDALTEGLATETAHSQGDSLLVLTILVCLGVGAIVAALALRGGERPGWTRISRNGSLAVVGVVIAAALVAFFAVNGPHRLSHAWDEFKQPATGSYQGTSRLGEVGGENRYQLWASALRQFEDDPFHGTGANTFQFWWTRDTDVGTAILDTHQLYLQVLGELGIVGFLLLLAFVLLTLGWGSVQALRAGPRARSWLAAAVAGSTVLWITSLVDWTWKLPIIPVATLLLIAVTVTAGDGGEGERSPSPLAIPWRLGVALVSLLAVVAIAIPLTGTSLVRDSQEEARAGDPEAALADARSAQNVQPGAATPRMQEALILESQGEIEAAAEAARAATEREPTNWRTWLLRSRIEAQRGRPQAALAAYLTAKSLNPLSSVFIRTG